MIASRQGGNKRADENQDALAFVASMFVPNVDVVSLPNHFRLWPDFVWTVYDSIMSTVSDQCLVSQQNRNI